MHVSPLARYTFVALAVFTLLGCEDTSQPIELALKLKKGKSYGMNVTLEQNISQAVMGQKQDVQQTTSMTLRMKATNVDADGVITLACRHERIQFKHKSGANQIEYDSDNPPASVHPMLRGFAALVGREFTMRMARNGQIIGFSGFDKIMDNIQAELALPEAVAKDFRERFGEDSLRQMMERVTVVYPDKPVRIGDSWSRRSVIDSGLPAIMENTWKLKSVKGGVAELDVRTKITPNPHAPPTRMGPMSMSYRLSGEQTGTMSIELASGWVIDGDLEQKMSGEITMAGLPEQTGERAWPVKIVSHITMERM